MDDPEELYNCDNGFTHERCIDMIPGSPDPRQPDPSSAEYPPYPQADPPRQYGYPTPPSGPHNQYSSIFQRPTPPEQTPFSLAGNQPLHGTAKQSAIARNAAITGIINGGAALYGTGFTIVLTNFNMTTMQITPSITSLLAIALGSLITAGLLTGGIFFLRGRGYKTLLLTAICQLISALCNIIIAFTHTEAASTFDAYGLFYRVFTEPFGAFGLAFSFCIIALLLMWQWERRASRSSQTTPTTTGQPHQYPFT